MATVIQLKDVYFRYPSSQWVLQGLDLTITQGEYLLICGANGSGKSTLGYLLKGLIPDFFGGDLQGRISVNDQPLEPGKGSELFADMGFVLQNADAQLFNSTVDSEIAFGLECLGLGSVEIDQRILSVTRTLKIEDLLQRSPLTLSGGEKRLVAIASVLCLRPSVLVLDEPFANLDWDGVHRVADTLRLIHQKGTGIVVIEQRLGPFLQDATRCIVLDQGKMLFDGALDSAREVFYAQHLAPCYPTRRQWALDSRESIIQLRNLSCRMGGREILTDVSLDIRKAQSVAIIGKNGSGKTTLIKHLNGLLHPEAGDLILEGERIQKKSPSLLAPVVGLSFQNPNDQFFKSTVKEELLVGLKKSGPASDGWLDEVCRLFELQHLLDRSPYRLSEGEKKRVAIASVFAMRPRILVLDEPTVGQDGRFRESLAAILIEIEDRGITNVIVTHDLDFALAAACRWIVLHKGRIVADGRSRDLLRDQQLLATGAMGGLDEVELKG